jgi:hypothetical protein
MTDTASIDGASRSIAAASSGVMFGRFISSSNFAPAARLTPENFRDEDRVRADGLDRIAQRLVESANQRRHADDRRDADDDAQHGQDRPQLVYAERVPRHPHDFIEEGPAHGVRLLPPQRFDRIQARRPRRRIEAEEQADAAVMEMPSTTDHTSTMAGSGTHAADEVGHQEPEPVPTMPPKVDSVIDSVRICHSTSRRRAPNDLRSRFARPFGHDHHMMFMMTMPPTTSERLTTPIRMAKIPEVTWL